MQRYHVIVSDTSRGDLRDTVHTATPPRLRSTSLLLSFSCRPPILFFLTKGVFLIQCCRSDDHTFSNSMELSHNLPKRVAGQLEKALPP
ncbi:unnamed protein product [Arctogadus glacialis]